MMKLVFAISIFASSVSFAEVVECKADASEKVSVTHNSKQIQTIDYIAGGQTKRVYSRTNQDSLNRGGYQVSYCNPDENEITESYGMQAHSRCRVAGSGADLMFYFLVNKDLTQGKISITYMGKDVIHNEIILSACSVVN